MDAGVESWTKMLARAKMGLKCNRLHYAAPRMTNTSTIRPLAQSQNRLLDASVEARARIGSSALAEHETA
jgi:hypothetical protein